MDDPMDQRPDDPDATRAPAPPSVAVSGLAFAQAANEAAATTARTAPAPVSTPAVTPAPPDREPLTRVPIDASGRPREPAIEWCRHEVRRVVAWHLVLNSVVVLGVVVPLCWWQLGSPTVSIGIGLAAAVLVGLIRIAVVLVAGPLGFSYVKTFTASPPDYLLAHRPTLASPPGPDPAAPAVGSTEVDLWDLDPNEIVEPAPAATVDDTTEAEHDPDDPDDPEPGRRAAIADVLREMGFVHAATVRADGRAGAVVDLYTDNALIVAAVERSSGSVTILTELAGFRVLVSSALLVPPTDELVVNVVDDADPAGLVLSHQRLVQQAFRARTRPSDPVGLFKLAQQRELEAYRELGPFWGAMLDLRCRPRGVRLAAAPDAGELLLFTGNRLFQHTP